MHLSHLGIVTTWRFVCAQPGQDRNQIGMYRTIDVIAVDRDACISYSHDAGSDCVRVGFAGPTREIRSTLEVYHRENAQHANYNSIYLHDAAIFQ